MIIEWTKDNIKVIPVLQGTLNIGKVTLLPGNNEVDEELWKNACLHVKNDIATGKIKVHHAEVNIKDVTPKAGKDDKESPKPEYEVKISARKLGKLSIQEAEEIVKNTYNLDTLAKWKKKEGRDTVAALIRLQIEAVEKHGTEKKGK